MIFVAIIEEIVIKYGQSGGDFQYSRVPRHIQWVDAFLLVFPRDCLVIYCHPVLFHVFCLYENLLKLTDVQDSKRCICTGCVYKNIV